MSRPPSAGGDKDAKRLVAVLDKVRPALNEAKPARSVDLYPEEKELLKPLFLLTMKPTMYVANVDEKGFDNNPLLDRIRDYAREEGAPVVAICAALEAQIADLSRRRQARVSRRHGAG